MYIILDDNFKFIGFSLKKEENYQSIEISEQEHDDFMSKQSEGYTLYFDKKNKKPRKYSIFTCCFRFKRKNSKIPMRPLRRVF